MPKNKMRKRENCTMKKNLYKIKKRDCFKKRPDNQS